MTVTINGTTGIAGVDGSAATPAVQGADANTGIFFSAADTIDFTEGGVATGQFDSSGNFKFNSGYGSAAVAYGCRAWVNFDGTTNTAGFCTIRGSGNVTSVADNGTGDYTVNFTTAMPDANFAAVGTTVGTSGTTRSGNVLGHYSLTTTSVGIRTQQGASDTSGGGSTDLAVNTIAIFR